MSYPSFKSNPIDVSTVPVAAQSITCLMMTADQIAVKHLKPSSGGKAPPKDLCKAANAAAIALAESTLDKATVARFKAKGQPLQLEPDDTSHTTGAGFLASDLKFDPHGKTAAPRNLSQPVTVQAVSLATKTTAGTFPGVYECIVLSPTKAAEWMMVDGLPRLP